MDAGLGVFRQFWQITVEVKMIPGRHPDRELCCGGRTRPPCSLPHNYVVIPDQRVDRARHRYLWWAGVTRGGPDALQCRQNRRGEFVGGQQLGIRAGCLGDQVQDVTIRSL